MSTYPRNLSREQTSLAVFFEVGLALCVSVAGLVITGIGVLTRDDTVLYLGIIATLGSLGYTGWTEIHAAQSPSRLNLKLLEYLDLFLAVAGTVLVIFGIYLFSTQMALLGFFLGFCGLALAVQTHEDVR